MIHFQYIESPVGMMRAVATEDGLVRLDFVDDAGDDGWVKNICLRLEVAASDMVESSYHPSLRSIDNQLSEYFAGERTTFDVPLLPMGSSFELRAWQYLTKIPYGQTRSYLQQAREVGDANASRAVGGANGRNPLSIVVPCHRVIASNGQMQGYGGGIERKKWLLRHEQMFAPDGLPGLIKRPHAIESKNTTAAASQTMAAASQR